MDWVHLTGPGAHSASSPMGTGHSFPRDEVARVWSCTSWHSA